MASYTNRVSALKKKSEEINSAAENRTIAAPESFHSLGGKYIKNADGGYSKVIAPQVRKDKDIKSVADTGHETLFTDLGQSLKGGLESWKAGHLSTLSTIDLAHAGIKNRDNNYQPRIGSALWKQLQASSASNRYASELMENSKEGRGFVGSTVMDVGSQAVMNGIDAAIRSIPVVGQALGTASFMSRSFGGAAQQKRDEGKSIATQVVSGAVSAAIEQFTESMSRIGGVRSYTGADTGWLDGAYNALESSIAKKAGPVIAKLATTMFSEGVEEIMSDVLTPLVTGALEGATKDTKLLGDFEAEEWQSVGDIAYDGLIGALSAIGGGMVESMQTNETYNKVGKDNALYAAAIREEFQQEKARAKKFQTIYDALDKKYSSKTKRSIQEAAMDATGQYVNRKQALAMLADSELDEVFKETAEKFANQSFANEEIDKDVLKEAAYNYLRSGEYADSDFQNINDARTQIDAFAKEVMAAYVNKQMDAAKALKGAKRQARLMFLASLRAKILNQNISTTEATSDVDAIDNMGYQRYQDQLEEEVPVTPAGKETFAQPAPVQQHGGNSYAAEDWTTMPNEDKAKVMLDTGRDRLRIEGSNNGKSISEAGHALFDAIQMEAVSRGLNAELVYNEQSKEWQAVLAESNLEAKTETRSDNAISKADQKKLDKIFTKLGTSIRIKADETAIRDAVYTRAKAENVDVVESKYGDRISLSIREKATGNPIVDSQREAKAQKNAAKEISASEQKMDVDAIIRAITPIEKLPENIAARNAALKKAKEQVLKRRAELSNQLGIEQEEEPTATVKRYGMGSTNPVRSAQFTIDRAIQGRLKGTGNADLQLAFNKLIKDIPSISRGSKDFLEQVSDFVLGNFEKEFVDNPYGEAGTEVKHSYLHKKGSKRGVEVRQDEYTHPTYTGDLTLSDTAKALFNIIQEMDERRLDINHWIAVSSQNSGVEAAEESKDAEKNAEEIAGESEEKEDKLDLRDEDFGKGGVFADMNEDTVRDIVNTLREGYDEESPTEEAINLRSSLMSGFAPSSEYTISDMTVAQRRKLLELAYPNEDFSISPINANEIIDSSVDTEKKEYERGERRWDRRHLKGGAESEDNQTAFGYAPVDSNKQTQVGTNAKGEPIMASGFVDSNKSTVADKLAAQNAIKLREEVKENVNTLRKQIDNINKAIDNVKTVLDNTSDAELSERLNAQIASLTDEVNQLNSKIAEEQNRITEELGKKGNWNSIIREEKRSVFNRTWIDTLSETQLDNVFGDNYNGYYNEHKLTQEETAYGKELLAERKARQGDTSSQFRKDIFEGSTDNRKNISSDDRGAERTGSNAYTPAESEISRLPQARRFSLSNNKGRVDYDGSNYISLYDDFDGGKQVGYELSGSETVGEAFDKARAVFADDKSVKKVVFLRGRVYDSYSNTLCGGITIYYNNGDKVILLAADNDDEFGSSAVHEKTHIDIDTARDNGVSNLTGLEYYKIARDIVGLNFDDVRALTAVEGGYDIDDYDGIIDEIICNAVAGKKCYHIDFSQYTDAFKSVIDGIKAGQYTHEFNDKSLEEWTGEKKKVDFSKLKRFAAGSNEEMQAREDAAKDAMYNEGRLADWNTPTLEDFKREQEQPKAAKKTSPEEAAKLVELSFGSKGKARATRAVERFKRIQPPKLKNESLNKRLHEKMSNMLDHLVNVNDGYGTVKDISDEYRGWRDDKTMADYWDDEVQARFDKILEDAEAKGWTFNTQEQREFSQAYEEATNALTARISNVNANADRLSKLQTEAVANKIGIKGDGLISKALQKFIRMQITTDTAMKMFGGFKGSGEFYNLGKDIKDGVAKRMIKYVDAYSHFDNLKKMDGFKEFAQNTGKYQLKFNSQFEHHDNPFKGVDLTLQQVVTISRLIKTLDKTFEHSDAKAADRIKGFVLRDSKGNSRTIDLGLGDTANDTEAAHNASAKMTAIKMACDEILGREGAVFEAARAYDKACDAMFKAMGKDVSATKKALTGNALSLIGEDYTPVLWANEDGSPADFNFNDDDRIRPPAFLYNRTGKQGYLVASDISYIVDKYIEKAADYIGTAQIKDTLSRLNNGTSLVENGKGLNTALAENFGKDAGSWFNEYVKDLTEYGENDSIWAALRRNMQKGALIGSPSVMMKQTSSYWSAMGLLSPEALAMAYRWKVGVKAAGNDEYNKLLKYRHISDNIDPTLTEIIKGMEKYGKASNSRVVQLFTNGISEQDFKTVDNLYTATMIDTYLKNQNRDADYFSSGEFQNDIDSKFTEVMMRSQPMFDTELRSEYARTDNELVKMTSMFRTQQTQNLNLIATAIGEYNASKGTGNQAEKAKVLRQTLAGQASAALSLSLLSVAADAMLHGLKKYRGDGDDDDEEAGDGKIELGRVLGRIGLNTVETGAGTVWFGDQMAKWLIDRMSGGETNEFYGVNLGPLTTFKNVLDNLEYVAKSPTPANIKNVAVNISQLMGIPINNAYRYVNSAVMYTADITGNNEHKYDDMLKMIGNNAKVAEKNTKGRNMLVESGMSKKEANAFVKLVDEDGDGLSKDELGEWYIEHPEDEDKVNMLWESMGWKTKFEKSKKNLDKQRVYRSNPLYEAMDEDESGSVTKSEMVEYALEHEDQLDELSELYNEQGFKGTFRSAIKSAEQTKLKEQAEDAFYDGDYNVLFDTVSQMKNGKTYLTNLIKDEYDEYDNVSNPLVRYMIDAKRPTKEIDAAVEEYGTKKLIPQYKALRSSGLSPSQAIQKLDSFDANANGSITQQELADYYKAHKDEEKTIAEFWKACGWSTSWKTYKKRKKIK